jgi:hypothetical protein
VLILGYFVANYANQWSFQAGMDNPGLGFGAIGIYFEILFPALAALGLLCVIINACILWSARNDQPSRLVNTIRLVSAVEGGLPAAILLYVVVEIITHHR